jgi:hypothetical protein
MPIQKPAFQVLSPTRFKGLKIGWRAEIAVFTVNHAFLNLWKRIINLC